MVFLGAELGNAEDRGLSLLFACCIQRDGADDLVDGDGREDDRDGMRFPPFRTGGTPKGPDVRGGP